MMTNEIKELVSSGNFEADLRKSGSLGAHQIQLFDSERAGLVTLVLTALGLRKGESLFVVGNNHNRSIDLSQFALPERE